MQDVNWTRSALVPALTLSKMRSCILAVDDDLDGEPLPEDLAGDSKGKLAIMPAGFVPSRWETVDPEQVEAQAMTTSKWDLLEQTEQHEQEDGEDFDSGGGDDSQEGDYQNYDIR
jgi:U2-associated protein SR140